MNVKELREEIQRKGGNPPKGMRKAALEEMLAAINEPKPKVLAQDVQKSDETDSVDDALAEESSDEPLTVEGEIVAVDELSITIDSEDEGRVSYADTLYKEVNVGDVVRVEINEDDAVTELEILRHTKPPVKHETVNTDDAAAKQQVKSLGGGIVRVMRPITQVSKRGDWTCPFSGKRVHSSLVYNPVNGAKREGSSASLCVAKEELDLLGGGN